MAFVGLERVGLQVLNHYLLVGLVVVNHLVDGAPVGQAANVAVVDPHVHLQFAAEVYVLCYVFLGEVAVDCIEFHSALAAPFYGIVQELAFAHAPKNEFVVLVDEHLKCLSGKGYLFADVWIAVTHDGAVEIYCNGHYWRGFYGAYGTYGTYGTYWTYWSYGNLKKQWGCKPGSVPRTKRVAYHLSTAAVTRRLYRSTLQLGRAALSWGRRMASALVAGLRELSTSGVHSPHVAMRLVGSYPAFSPLPAAPVPQAVVFFCTCKPSRTSIG